MGNAQLPAFQPRKRKLIPNAFREVVRRLVTLKYGSPAFRGCVLGELLGIEGWGEFLREVPPAQQRLIDGHRKNVILALSFEELAYSNMLTLNTLVALLTEKGVLSKPEILERIGGSTERKTKVSVWQDVSSPPAQFPSHYLTLCLQR